MPVKPFRSLLASIRKIEAEGWDQSACGAARVVFFSAVLFQFRHPDFNLWAQLSPEFWHPVWYLNFSLISPPSSEAVLVATRAWQGLLGLSAIGILTPLVTPLAALLGTLLFGVRMSQGYINHVDNLNCLCLWVFALSNCAQAYSLDSLLWKRENSGRFRDCQLSPGATFLALWCLWAQVFFLAGLSKLVSSPRDWFSGAIIAQAISRNQFLMKDYLIFQLNNHQLLWLEKPSLIIKATAALAVLLELLAPIVLFGRRIRYVIVFTMLALQAAIFAVMGLNFSHQLPAYLMFFPWAVIFRTWRLPGKSIFHLIRSRSIDPKFRRS